MDKFTNLADHARHATVTSLILTRTVGLHSCKFFSVYLGCLLVGNRNILVRVTDENVSARWAVITHRIAQFPKVQTHPFGGKMVNSCLPCIPISEYLVDLNHLSLRIETITMVVGKQFSDKAFVVMQRLFLPTRYQGKLVSIPASMPGVGIVSRPRLQTETKR